MEKYPDSIVINNRILLKINGKPISVMDVVKKMDLLFYRQYPELATNPIARYQFYAASWRTVLTSTIDDQLIVADAKEKQVEITDGEVREELENLFGPDVVLNLDKLGMTLSEAFDLLKTEIVVRRMMGIMVRSKAMAEMHPSSVRQRYEEWSENNPPQEYWVYRVLSIRGEKHKEVAEQAYQMIHDQNISLETVPEALRQEGIEITLSEEYTRIDRELSKAHRAILETISVGSTSLPEAQKETSRIFCLKTHETKTPSSFKDMEEKIRGEMMEESVAKHNLAYRGRLREYYGLSETVLKTEVPEGLEPFALR